jgi:hydrogenase maturation protease
MKPTSAQCLILACGNTLRGDDGIGPWLSAWAEERFDDDPAVRVISRQQWTPDLAQDIAEAESVIFVDCSIDSAPGEVRVIPVEAAPAGPGLASHHVGAPELLALGRELYDSLPLTAWMLTVGAGSLEFGETFSKSVIDSLPAACKELENAVRIHLTSSRTSKPAQRP